MGGRVKHNVNLTFCIVTLSRRLPLVKINIEMHCCYCEANKHLKDFEIPVDFLATEDNKSLFRKAVKPFEMLDHLRTLHLKSDDQADANYAAGENKNRFNSNTVMLRTRARALI